MKRINTSPISGMQELLPGLQAEFNRLKTGVAAAYHAHGYQSIETPTIERAEILLAKAGGDTEKQIYKVVKTAEAAEGADQALRFDHTVPLARYVVEHANDLAFPFKVTQIGRNFRGERAQKGRFREFYQCDADVIGWQTLPVAYDADVMATLLDALAIFPLPEILMRVSNRKILSGLLVALGCEDKFTEVSDVIDHCEKWESERVREALNEASRPAAETILRFMAINGPRAEAVPALKAISEHEAYIAGVDELNEVLARLEERGVTNAVADMRIVRGLDYYTGTVFEAIVPQHREIGSICGGGRYENLASNYTDEKLPGVGGSIGLTRLFYILREYGFIETNEAKPVDYCLVPISKNEEKVASELAAKLRGAGHSVDIVLSEKRLGDKMNYAAKTAKYAVVIGEDEAKSGKYEAKDLVTGERFPII